MQGFCPQKNGLDKQEGVCLLLFGLLGNSGLKLAFECRIGKQNCSGHLSFPLIRYSRWLGSNPKIAPDIIASAAGASSLSGRGWPRGLRRPRRGLQHGEGGLPGSAAAPEGGQPCPTPLPSHPGFTLGAQAPLLLPFSARNQINSFPW